MSAGTLGSGSTLDDVDVLLEAHEAVLPAVRLAAGSLAQAIDLIVDGVSRGGRLIYVGAGTSGWLAALDASEVVVTFGMAGRVLSVVGGGKLLDPESMTLGDDAVDSLTDDPTLATCDEADVVLAVSASGGTPFTVAAVEKARATGARIIAIVNQADSALSSFADVVVLVSIASEVVAGSTRLTAGLAQKVILNTLSTVSMVRLGRTVNGQMVCVEPLNEKLRQRLVVAVATAAAVDEDTARTALAEAGRGDVAVVALMAGVDVGLARERLSKARGDIHRAVSTG
jgi:N-acetylmuramic acid 6-phosphate etherase